MAKKPDLPEYIQRFLDGRRHLVIVVHPHALRSRARQKPVTSQQIDRAVLEGEVLLPDCQEFPERPYDKYAVAFYFGDESRTIKLILTVNWETWFCQLETLWTCKGRLQPPRSASGRRKMS